MPGNDSKNDSPAESMYPRAAAARVAAALKDTPVVMVNGPRQCGKTTLVRAFASAKRAYLTLDDETQLAAARAGPEGFLRPHASLVLDEVQRAPDLLRAIKKSVDEDRRPGRFLLTGSADMMTLPTISDSLAGRMEVVTLLPLSQAELRRRESRFLARAFGGGLPRPSDSPAGSDLLQIILTGGYPEMLRRPDPARRRAWARDYLSAIVMRDARDIADIDKLDQLPRLLRLLAHHAGQLTNFAQLGGQIGLDDKTTRKYVGVLEQLFLVRRLEPWHSNRLSRLIKTPKLHFLDSGLLAALMGLVPARLAADRSLLGPLLESFVFGELLKQAGVWGEVHTLHHYRDKDQNEVDVIVENESGDLIGIEVKAAASVRASDFNGLRRLEQATGKRFRLGVVLHDGGAVAAFGERLFAAPLGVIWA